MAVRRCCGVGLRNSAYATAEGGELRYGWLANYAYNLNYGYTLSKTKRFKRCQDHRAGGTITLSKGHHVEGRRYLENNFARWYQRVSATLAGASTKWAPVEGLQIMTLARIPGIDGSNGTRRPVEPWAAC